jgi:beta-phosphoglucomutase-like phosphatase (HAD superfamily)
MTNLTDIKLLVMDVDGVLTDTAIIINAMLMAARARFSAHLTATVFECGKGPDSKPLF